MRDITASGSFQALAEAIRLNGVAKSQRGRDPRLEELLIPEAATIIASH